MGYARHSFQAEAAADPFYARNRNDRNLFIYADWASEQSQ